MSDDIIDRAEAALALRWEQPGSDYPEPVPTGLVWLGDWASEHLGELVAELKTTRAQLRQLSASLEEVWDDGNCTGLDGWIGPGRGTAEPDRDALHARDRVINKVLREIDGGG